MKEASLLFRESAESQRQLGLVVERLEPLLAGTLDQYRSRAFTSPPPAGWRVPFLPPWSDDFLGIWKYK